MSRPISRTEGLDSIAESERPSVDAGNLPVYVLPRLVAEWLSTSKAAGKISTKALHAYESDLARWATLLAKNGDGPALDRLRLEDLTTSGIEAALVSLGWARLGRAQRERTIASINDLCNWLVQHEVLTTNPVASVRATARVHTKTRRVLGSSPPD